MGVRSIEAIVKALNQAKIQYLIVGGVAVNAHGYERFTKDLDLVIGKISSVDFTHCSPLDTRCEFPLRQNNLLIPI
jgi:hypothetical protein